MKFCKSCKTIHADSESVCAHCGKALKTITDINEPVRLCVIGGTERAMLNGLLSDADIPYIEGNDHPQGVANELVTGYDVKLNNISVTVPFQALPKAIELLSSIETVDNPLEPLLPAIKAHIASLRSGAVSDDARMSPALRTTVKVVSAILFLLLLALVVLGTDKLTELIKGLFGG